jgi:glyoxylase-like metal-dependent hydrolase (beta-lactamase superfamily II)
MGSEQLLAYLSAHQLTVEYIFLTHEHFDHCAGLNALRAATHAPLWCSASCSTLIQQSRGNYSAYCLEGEPFEVAAANHLLASVETLEWHLHTIKFYATPGHSQACISICIDKTALFTGDNYVPGIRTYTNLSGGNKEDLRITLAFYSLFAQYPDMTVYPGHLEPVPIAHARFAQSLRGYSEKQMQEVASHLASPF